MKWKNKFFNPKKKKKYPKGYPRLSPPPPHIPIEERLAAIRELRSKNQRQLYSRFYNLKISSLAFLINRIVELFYYSCRIKSFRIHPETKSLIDDPRGQFIVAFWHNRLFYLSFSIRQNILRKGHDLLAIVSPSRDGELTSRVGVNWGTYITRGSSSRGGVRALQEIRRYLNLHFHPLIIGDGPRGPRYELKKGLPFLARLSGLGIVPCCYAAQKEWVLSKSWDAFSIPKPFSPIVVEYGKAIYIDKNMDIEKARLLIQEKMQKQLQRLENSF